MELVGLPWISGLVQALAHSNFQGIDPEGRARTLLSGLDFLEGSISHHEVGELEGGNEFTILRGI